MWTPREISDLAQTLNSFKLEEIVDEKELEAIPSTAVPNLHSHLFEPRHNRDVSFDIKIIFSRQFFRKKP